MYTYASFAIVILYKVNKIYTLYNIRRNSPFNLVLVVKVNVKVEDVGKGFFKEITLKKGSL